MQRRGYVGQVGLRARGQHWGGGARRQTGPPGVLSSYCRSIASESLQSSGHSMHTGRQVTHTKHSYPSPVSLFTPPCFISVALTPLYLTSRLRGRLSTMMPFSMSRVIVKWVCSVVIVNTICTFFSPRNILTAMYLAFARSVVEEKVRAQSPACKHQAWPRACAVSTAASSTVRSVLTWMTPPSTMSLSPVKRRFRRRNYSLSFTIYSVAALLSFAQACYLCALT